jgi:nucleoside 2-deoxyribosyltransferase
MAGPITGLSYDSCNDWRNYVSERLNTSKIECLNPMRGKQFLQEVNNIEAITEQYQNPITTHKAITRRDMFDTLRSACLFVNLLGSTRVSIGTCMELAWAYQNQIPTIVLMEKDNIHRHAMLNETCTYIVDTLDQGINLVKFLMNEEG